MLVHLGEGYFVEKNCVMYIFPLKKEYSIEVGFNDGKVNFPYRILDTLIAALDK